MKLNVLIFITSLIVSLYSCAYIGERLFSLPFSSS